MNLLEPNPVEKKQSIKTEFIEKELGGSGPAKNQLPAPSPTPRAQKYS
jgi:hypothetical protein